MLAHEMLGEESTVEVRARVAAFCASWRRDDMRGESVEEHEGFASVGVLAADSWRQELPALDQVRQLAGGADDAIHK